MDKSDLEILSNVLCDKDGFKFVLLLLDKLGAFDRGINPNLSDKQIFMTLGKREKGLWLLDNIYEANPEKYTELLKERRKIYATGK